MEHKLVAYNFISLRFNSTRFEKVHFLQNNNNITTEKVCFKIMFVTNVLMMPKNGNTYVSIQHREGNLK